ncbi:MAG: tetratricopeptide repeat protein [Isosphaeraceae bacterium]
MAPTEMCPRSRPRSWRGVWFRVAAVVLGLAPLIVAEALLSALGWGQPDLHDDPFVGFSAVRPLFVLDSTRTRYETATSRLTYFRRVSFPARKPLGEFRIFCLGGSTVQGRPFSIETSFTTWLELGLNAADPSRHWRVINCGGVSYASYREVPIIEEILHYQPDLIILCTGHNEFLEDRTYQQIKRIPDVLRRPLELAAEMRTFHVLNSGIQSFFQDQREPDRPILGSEVDTLLDYRGGLASYHRDEHWRRNVIDHFAFNLRRMVELGRAAGVPTLLVNPVVNLDTPPFKSEHRAGLTDLERRQFDALRHKAARQFGGDPEETIRLLRQALDIDDQHAGLHYDLAKCAQQQGRIVEARAEFLRAKELDVCPLRILEPMSQAILEVADATDSPLVDLVPVFERRSQGGILGYDWLVDHVHPSIKGHRLIASVLIEAMTRQGFVQPVPGWTAERERRERDHLNSLDDFYYLLGQKRLTGLRLWASGRGTKGRNGAKSSRFKLLESSVMNSQ